MIPDWPDVSSVPPTGVKYRNSKRMDRLFRLKESWNHFSGSSNGRAILRAIRWLFLAAILVFLAVQLTRIGWIEIWRSLPTNPLFYVLFLGIYFSLPLTEVLIYRLTWDLRFWSSLPAFIKKRIYNREVVGYSGEVYFMTWVRRNLGVSDREVLETVRDNNIVSSIASTLVALTLLSVFLFESTLGVAELIGDANIYYVAGGGLVLTVLLALAARFRRYLFSMPLKIALLIGGIQVVRLLAGQAMQIGQWEVAVPEVTWQAWFTLAVASIVVTRIPLIPNAELIFVGAGIELSHNMNAPTAPIAGMLLVTGVLGKALNFILFAALSIRSGREPSRPSSSPNSANEGPRGAPGERDGGEPDTGDEPSPASVPA